MSAPTLSSQLVVRSGGFEVSLELEATQRTLALVGPNGAGKTTALLGLLGLLPALRGSLRLGDDVLVDVERGVFVPTEARRIGYVPQEYALFPHLDARENVMFALRASGQHPKDSRAITRQRALALLERVEVGHVADRRPQTLSGGERQRVALARALATSPRALLLDEPLAALDVSMRDQVRTFLREQLRALAIPAIVVTHDAEDVAALADDVAILEQGRIVQHGPLDSVVSSPQTAYGRSFSERVQLVRSRGGR